MARRLGASSTSMAAGSRAPPAKPRAPSASFFDDPSGMVDLAWAANTPARRRAKHGG
jgi:hypothetical protein